MSAHPQAGHRPLAHTADVGLQVWGRTRAELFRQAARGVNTLVFEGESKARVVSRTFSLSHGSHSQVFHHFLGELVFLAMQERFVTADLTLHRQTGGGLRVEVRGAILPPAAILREIKSPTYHRLRVTTRPGRWTATVYFDV